jgi:hypothetical protein
MMTSGRTGSPFLQIGWPNQIGLDSNRLLQIALDVKKARSLVFTWLSGLAGLLRMC